MSNSIYDLPTSPQDEPFGWDALSAAPAPAPSSVYDLDADPAAGIKDASAQKRYDAPAPTYAEPVRPEHAYAESVYPAPSYADPAAFPLGQVPTGRRAAVATAGETMLGLPARDESTYEIDGTLTPVERAALERADKTLIRALHEVVFQKASDLHVTVGALPMVRIDGALRPAVDGEPWSQSRIREALYSLLSPAQKEIFETELELDFAFTISANSRFRVNFYQQRGSVGAAFRLIPVEIKKLRELGVPDVIGSFAGLPRGLVLVTGPTGSGKSTTLAALIDLVNETRADHIVTVEDPIEFMHGHKRSLVNQREVGADTHSFAAALKHVLRQDPDVILIGELRDLETISVALTAAETGHLVFATLHTQDAPQTIDRVIDVFPPHQQGQVRAQLAGTLQGVVCQTLVKRASGAGRVVATEVLMMTPAIGNLIREGKTYQIASMMQAGRDLGMHTMDQHLADLANVGTITVRAAMDKAHDPDGIVRLIDRVDTGLDETARAVAAAGIDYGDHFSGGVR